MAGITAAGAGSGIDIESLITQLMAAEKKPLTKIATKEASIQSKISMIGQFKSLISGLQAAAGNLQNLGKLNGIKATVGNANALSVTATNKASTASYTVDVLQLAKSQQVVSNAGVFRSASDILVNSASGAASATVSLSFGTAGAGSSATKEISLSAGATLQDLVNTINGGDYGVNASLISDKTGSVRLSLTGKETGAENAFKIDVAYKDSAGNAITSFVDESGDEQVDNTPLLSSIIFDPSTASASNFTVNTDAQDSRIKLNGVEVTRATNTINDAVEGLSFTLKATTIPDGAEVSTATTLTVGRDATTISTQLGAFVTAYNQLASAIKNTTSYDATTKTAGALQGDSTIRNLQTQLRSFINGVFGDGSNSTKTLSNLGIAVQKDGTLALDSTKLNKAITDDLDGVIKFLGAFDQTVSTIAPESSKGGFAYKLEQLTKGFLANGGLLNSRLDGLNKTVKDLEKQYERFESRLEQIEKRYRAQFTAMDMAVSNMQGLSSYVSLLQDMATSKS